MTHSPGSAGTYAAGLGDRTQNSAGTRFCEKSVVQTLFLRRRQDDLSRNDIARLRFRLYSALARHDIIDQRNGFHRFPMKER